MASSLFTPDQKEIIHENPIVRLHHDGLSKDSFDQGIGEGT
jgi:hypothetical protein